MVIAYHVILSAYGFWLPNDPRGSWSTWVRKWELLRYGGPTKVDTCRSVADRRHNRVNREQAKSALRYPPVKFDGEQARAIVRGFAQACDESGYRALACSILPEHVHLVIERCDRPIEQIIAHLKGRATRRLRADGLDPMQRYTDADGRTPSPWAEGSWKVFIDNAEHLWRAVRYVRENPLREGKREQRWRFVCGF